MLLSGRVICFRQTSREFRILSRTVGHRMNLRILTFVCLLLASPRSCLGLNKGDATQTFPVDRVAPFKFTTIGGVFLQDDPATNDTSFEYVRRLFEEASRFPVPITHTFRRGRTWASLTVHTQLIRSSTRNIKRRSGSASNTTCIN